MATDDGKSFTFYRSNIDVYREDLNMHSQMIDNVTNKIEESLQKFYIYDIHTITPSAVLFEKNIVKACENVAKSIATVIMKNT